MKRYPEGIEGISFHQHDVKDAPDYVRTATIDVEEGHEVEYIIGGTLSTLLYMANLGAIERHPWHSRVRNIDRPDWLVFDLDPGAGVSFTTICEVALSTKDILEKLGLESYAKTSGSRGLHVYVPLKAIHSYEQAADFALKVATLVARANPDAATIERALKKRKPAQMYVDHMQNARGKSVVAPYSVRPKQGAMVSAPLKWGEVKGKKIMLEDFTIATMPRRLARVGDLFKPVLLNKQSLHDAFARVERMID
jgi:bifunctional non-homologous end joining protein LigD